MGLLRGEEPSIKTEFPYETWLSAAKSWNLID